MISLEALTPHEQCCQLLVLGGTVVRRDPVIVCAIHVETITIRHIPIRGKNSKKIDGEQLVYNSKGYYRTEPCLALQPLGTASNSYSFFNLRTGKRVVSHIAYPRAYDDEILQLFSKLETASSTVSAPTELQDMSTIYLQTLRQGCQLLSLPNMLMTLMKFLH